MAMKEYMITNINLAKVKERFSTYIAEVEKGKTVVICKHNRPVARLVPVEDPRTGNRTKLGSARGTVAVNCDLTEPVIDDGDWEIHR
jgi:prevent-host-death family protein